MARKVSFAVVVLMVIAAGLLIAGSWAVHRSSEESCGICQRHINAQAGVIAEVGTRRVHVCCAHCAITEGLQEHKPVRLIEVTDYVTGRRLDPSTAWYVDGSRVLACTHDMSRMDEMKQIDVKTFDRCSPGTFAFASREAAEAFSAKNGGVIHNLQEMLAGVNSGEARQ